MSICTRKLTQSNALSCTTRVTSWQETRWPKESKLCPGWLPQPARTSGTTPSGCAPAHPQTQVKVAKRASTRLATLAGPNLGDYTQWMRSHAPTNSSQGSQKSFDPAGYPSRPEPRGLHLVDALSRTHKLKSR